MALESSGKYPDLNLPSATAEAAVCDQSVQFEVGKVAKLADGSCIARSGNAVVLATVVSTPVVGDVPADGLPLQVRHVWLVLRLHVCMWIGRIKCW